MRYAPRTLEDAVRRAEMMRAALFEEGVGPSDIKVAGPGGRAVGASTISPVSLRPLTRKAGYLVKLRLDGADAIAPCPQRHMLDCPGHPVGALLAGTIKVCAS